MDKKRTVSYVLCTIMIGLLIVGCGNSDRGTAKTSIDTSKKEISAPTSVETSYDSNKQDEKTESESLPEKSEPTGEEVSIEETVILDQDGIKVTAKNIDNSIFGPVVVMMMENDSGKDLTFQARDVSVNGYMMQSMFSCEVVNGKKANDTMTIMKTELEKAQISTIADIEFSLHIFESSSWEDVLNTEPIKLVTSAAANYNYAYDDSGDLAYDGSGAVICLD